MTTYLFTWNPERWSWTYLQASIAQVKQHGYCKERWSCGITKRIKLEDRAFLIKLGKEPRGLVASGWIASTVYESPHWNTSQREAGLLANFVDIHWDTILDPDVDIFPRQWLDTGIYARMHWNSQSSGVTIPSEVAFQLEQDWAKFLNRPVFVFETELDETNYEKVFLEGATHQIKVNAYERSAEARTICLNYHGLNCSVCGFNFEKFYGEVGSGFIHVHHLKPLSEIRNGYQLNPIKDLRPVCPNCHAMLHQRKPAYSIDELKAKLAEKN